MRLRASLCFNHNYLHIMVEGVVIIVYLLKFGDPIQLSSTLSLPQRIILSTRHRQFPFLSKRINHQFLWLFTWSGQSQVATFALGVVTLDYVNNLNKKI